ncbi:MAG: hypothetical protein ABI542_07580 [Gemmatimonadota bacterium]
MTYKFKLSRRLAASHRPTRVVAVSSLLILLAACGASSPTGPGTSEQPATPGWLTVQLTTPFSDDGALQLRVSGPSIDSIAPEAAYDGFGTVSSGVADVVITGSVANGNVARFRVADVTRASQYMVSVVAAAQQTTYALRPNNAVYGAVIVR